MDFCNGNLLQGFPVGSGQGGDHQADTVAQTPACCSLCSPSGVWTGRKSSSAQCSSDSSLLYPVSTKLLRIPQGYRICLVCVGSGFDLNSKGVRLGKSHRTMSNQIYKYIYITILCIRKNLEVIYENKTYKGWS